ncbi:hypothetical protein EJB05_45842, partial [Eragrostis curvula]
MKYNAGSGSGSAPNDTPEQAALDAASVSLRGVADGLNFPGSPPAVRRRTSDVREVYAAAVSHANNKEKGHGCRRHSRWKDLLRRARSAAPLQVSAVRMDWSQMMANPPPLFSPTVVGATTHLKPVATDVYMEMDETGACSGLWEF